MPTTWTQLAVAVLTPILFALLLLASRRISVFIMHTVHNSDVQAVLLRLNDAVFDLVGEMAQTMLSDARDSDGKLPVDVAKKARDDVLAKLKEQLGPTGVAKAREVLGVDDAALERILVSKIEAAVAELKSAA
jgi:hypothetical protein